MAPGIRHIAAGLLLLAGCAGEPDLAVPTPQPLDTPAPAGAALPHLAPSGTGVLLSWTEPRDSGHALRFARWTDDGWSAPLDVAQGADWFVNWADFPSVVDVGDGRLVAHWLQRSGPGTYAYDVLLSQSADGGRTWSQPVVPHTDGTATEHGFVSVFGVDGGAAAVWLDGRLYADSEGPPSEEMTLRFTTLGAGGEPLPEVTLDARVCDCCQTGAAVTGRGPIVVYRDRSETELRDISAVRLVNGAWTEPTPVHADGWQIDACPVNGPQVDADGDDVAVAWFTAQGDSARVLLAFSADAGATFGPPVHVDQGQPLGRVDVLLLPDGRALVTWLERSSDAAEIRARLIDRRTGGMSEPVTLGATSSRRSSGFPRAARQGSDVVVAWASGEAEGGIRAVVLPFGRTE